MTSKHGKPNPFSNLQDSGQKLLEIIVNHSPTEDAGAGGAATGQTERQSRMDQRVLRANPIKSLDLALEIIKDILVKDLERPPQHSQTYQLLTEFPDTEPVFQY